MQSFTYKKNGRSHVVRNRQAEYVGAKQENVSVLEFLCGRKAEEEKCVVTETVTCKACENH